MSFDRHHSVGSTLLVAVQKKFESDRACAIAHLKNYIENPSAIGEHPDLIGEMIKLVEHISDAEDALEVVDNVLKETTGNGTE